MRFIWIILALPSLPLLWDLWANERYFAELMSESGMLSIQFLILTLAITPLRTLARPYDKLHPLIRWLTRNRRYFGVASFGYAMLHVIFYIRYTEALYDVAIEAIEPRYFAGWIAVLIMSLMAATSNNASQRALGGHWKTLQRTIYFGTLALFAHWLLFAFQYEDVILYAAAFLLIRAPQLFQRRSNA